MATGLSKTSDQAGTSFEQWIDLASPCSVPVRITDLQARLVYANAAWRKLTNLDQARSNALGWLDVIQPRQRTEVLGRLLDSDAPTDGISHVYAMTCGQSVCETLGICKDDQGHRLGHIAFIGTLATAPLDPTIIASGQKAANLNAHGLGRYNPTIHAAAALVDEVSLPLMATTAYAQAAQNHIISGLKSDYGQADRAIAHAVQESVQAANHLRRLRAVLTQGHAYFEPVDLCGLISAAIEDSQMLCQQLGVNLVAKLYHGPCMAALQASQIYEVLKQLMSHCLEHLSSSHPARVFVELTQAPEDQWQITIGTDDVQMPKAKADWNPDKTSLTIASARAIILAHDGKLIIAPSSPASQAISYRILIPCLAED